MPLLGRNLRLLSGLNLMRYFSLHSVTKVFFAELTFPKGHLPVLGALRGIAILMVVFAHFTGNGKLLFGDPLPVNLGRYGVEIFFAISGYLMGGLLFCKKQQLRVFYVRRFSRIFPALLLYLTLVWACHFSLGAPFEALPFTSTWFFFTNYLLAVDVTFLHRDFGHLWSLCIEEHSYMLLSIIAIITRRFWSKDLKIILFVAVLFMCMGVYYSVILKMDYRESYWRTDARAASIFLASFIAVTMERRTLCQFRASWPIGLISLLMGLVFNASYFPDVVKYTLGSACTAFAVCSLASAQINWESRTINFSVSLLCFFGLISYSFYLWQQFFSARVNGWMNFAALMICIIVSIFSFVFIEQPARRKINAYFLKKH